MYPRDRPRFSKLSKRYYVNFWYDYVTKRVCYCLLRVCLGLVFLGTHLGLPFVFCR
jgi:hypothetical protein